MMGMMGMWRRQQDGQQRKEHPPPAGSRSLERNLALSGKKNGFPAGTALAAIVVLGIVIFSLWNRNPDHQAAGSMKSRAGDTALLHDFRTVWRWTAAIWADGAGAGPGQGRWSFRIDGQWSQAETAQLASALGVIMTARPGGHGQQGYGGEAILEDGHRTAVFYSGGKAVLTVQAREESGEASMIQLIERIERTLAEDKLAYTSSFAVRGMPQSQEAGTELAAKAELVEQEVYNDGHTESITYSSTKLRTHVMSGGKAVNAQIAMIAGDAGAAPEMVVGVPLITGDYRITDSAK